MRRPLLLAAALATAVAGCGQDRHAAGAAGEEVRATLYAYADAVRAHDYGAQCRLISLVSALSAVRTVAGARDCTSAMAVLNRETKPAERAVIAAAAITVSGGRAAARSGAGRAAQLVRENGGWRLEALAPVPAAPVATTQAPQPATPPVRDTSRFGSDAAAKSDARQAVSLIEACMVDTASYAACVPVKGMPADALPVEVRNAGADSYEIAVRSPSGNEYRIARDPGGVFRRTCTPVQQTSACRDGSW
jgi:hypothetical protein